ncbi:unnamed protein product [Blepharisma stoltei]|uniref:Uncharacterized protein n=1 Tax=Blepharisma stoltei TaxID=1481888 RepID=A0AAU9IJP0_9CILI|nr:unnamed protein product [Blepharisma stoltei]
MILVEAYFLASPIVMEPTQSEEAVHKSWLWLMRSICSCVITRSASLSLKAGLANAAKTKPKKMMFFILLFPHNLSS